MEFEPVDNLEPFLRSAYGQRCCLPSWTHQETTNTWPGQSLHSSWELLEDLHKPKALGLWLGLPAVDGLHLEASGAYPWSASDCWCCGLRKAKAPRTLWWGLPGCPFSVGCCWQEHTQHFTSDVRYYLHMCEEHARPQHANCSLRGSIVAGAEQVAAHLPPEGSCSRGDLFPLEFNHSPCVTVHVKWDNQAQCMTCFFLSSRQ